MVPELPARKVRPTSGTPTFDPNKALVQGARGEGVALQVVLRSDATLAGLTPEMATPFTNATSGAVIESGAVRLYRVGYVDVTHASDEAGATGLWPDALYPIGTDGGTPLFGAPFTLNAGENLSIWVEIRIPKDVFPSRPTDGPMGDYTGTLAVLQNGIVLVRLDLRLRVWNVQLPDQPYFPTTYTFGARTAYYYHFDRSTDPTDEQRAEFIDLMNSYLLEAAAHRITLDPSSWDNVFPYNYDLESDTATLIQSHPDAAFWDQFLASPGRTTYPIPYPHSMGVLWNGDGAQRKEAVAFWRAVQAHYDSSQAVDGMQWRERNFLYTLPDEPPPSDFPINNVQSATLHDSDTSRSASLRSLVVKEYRPELASGDFDIWCPIVNLIDPANQGRLEPNLLNQQNLHKQVWWYDSDNSDLPDALGRGGNWPDEFIDHQGVNQLIHGPLSWKYGLQGYLYYETVINFGFLGKDVWTHNQYTRPDGDILPAGDGTLFYPGRPGDIGGSTHRAVPSVRLQLLRQSWSMYDLLVILSQGGKKDMADMLVNRLFPPLTPGTLTVNDWSKVPEEYEAFRSALYAAIARPGSTPAPIMILRGGSIPEAAFSLQGAIDSARPGDVITIGVGETVRENVILRKKDGQGTITIRTDPDTSLPPAGSRVHPSDALAKLAGAGAEPVIRTDPGAHDYTLIGLEIVAFESGSVLDVVSLGDTVQAIEDVPRNIILDRCYIHGGENQEVVHGVILNSQATAVRGCYIAGCHMDKSGDRDSWAIGGWNGPGPFEITNCYLEGGDQCVLFGGDDPSIDRLVPSDITFRRNHCRKPPAWRALNWKVKNLFELKNAQRVMIEGNVFEYSWIRADKAPQNGWALLFGPRNQESKSEWSVVQDVTFRGNIIRHAGGGVSLFGMDDQFPSQVLNSVTIQNNLFVDLNRIPWAERPDQAVRVLDGGWVEVDGSGNPSGIRVIHNTAFQSGPVLYAVGNEDTGASDPNKKTRMFVFDSNIVSYKLPADFNPPPPADVAQGVGGDGTSEGTDVLAFYFPGFDFRRNIIPGAPAGKYPGDNFYLEGVGPEATVHDVFDELDLTPGQERLQLKAEFKGMGTDMQDPGCDIAAIKSLTDGVEEPPLPSPSSSSLRERARE